jgi:hypothetical protein
MTAPDKARQDVSQEFLDAEWRISEICTAFVHKGNMPAYAVWEGFLRNDWPIISETVAHVRSELDAARQRIAEIESERTAILLERNNLMASLAYTEQAAKEAHRTGFLECQRQAVQVARDYTFDEERQHSNKAVQANVAQNIAQAISLLQPAEGDDATE